MPSQVNGLHAPHSAGYSISATRAQASFWVGYRYDSIVCKYSIRSPHVYPCASVSHAPLSHETQEHRSGDISLRFVSGSKSGVVASSCISDGLGAIAGTGSGVGTVTGTDMGLVGADTGGSLDHENAKTEFKKADMLSLTSGGNIERWRRSKRPGGSDSLAFSDSSRSRPRPRRSPTTAPPFKLLRFVRRPSSATTDDSSSTHGTEISTWNATDVFMVYTRNPLL